VTAADEQLVTELAEALWSIARSGSGFIAPEANAAALLPVVLADRRRAVAAELRDAASETTDFALTSLWLRARADVVEADQ
jgi:hypothetical protein